MSYATETATRILAKIRDREDAPTSGQVAAAITDVPDEVLRAVGFAGDGDELYQAACYQVAVKVLEILEEEVK